MSSSPSPMKYTMSYNVLQPQVSLCSIISDFLAGQHALCRNPMSICPEFDLFLPHKCPDQRAKRAAPLNLTTR